jgi:hypothetical protein
MPQEVMPIAKIPLLLNSRVQSKNFNDLRSILVKELRCLSGIPEFASTVKPEELYTIVLQPENAYMQMDSSGNFQAVWRNKDGKIVQHTRLKALQPSVVKIASALGTQVMLISIVMQLNRIEKRLINLEKEFHNDRLSEIKAGINTYNQAIEANSPDTKLKLVTAAIPELNRGVEKTLTSLKQQIEKIPDVKIGFFDNWGSNKSSESNEKFYLAEESFQAVLMGVQTLTQCYTVIDEPKIATNVLATYIEKINSCGIESAATKARLVPYEKGSQAPEMIWNSFLENKATISSHINNCTRIADNRFGAIEIEIKPSELMG